MPEKVVEAKIPIHAWLVKRAHYDPSFRVKLEAELGRKAFEIAKKEASKS